MSYSSDATIAASIEATLTLVHLQEVSVHTTLFLDQCLDFVSAKAAKGQPNRSVDHRWTLSLDKVLMIGVSDDDEDLLRGNSVGVIVVSPERMKPFRQENFDAISWGLLSMSNPETAGAGLCGLLTSLVGLVSALHVKDLPLIDTTMDRNLLMHGVILSFGGIPLLYNAELLGDRRLQ